MTKRLTQKLSHLLCATVCCMGVFSTDSAWSAPTGFVLDVELSSATCRLNTHLKKSRQCLDGYAMSVVGLLPEGVKHKSCETAHLFNLTPIQRRLLMRIMPDEHAQMRLWKSIGGCVEMNAPQYFRTMLQLADRLNMPAELSSNQTIHVHRDRLQQRFLQLNRDMPMQAIHLSCHAARGQAVLTQIQVCYKQNGQYQACDVEKARSSCPSQFQILGTY